MHSTPCESSLDLSDLSVSPVGTVCVILVPVPVPVPEPVLVLVLNLSFS